MPDPVFFAVSERGGRESNEDSVLARWTGEHLLLGVADGLGGHARGEVASRTAVEEVDRLDPAGFTPEAFGALLRSAFSSANTRISRYNRDNGVNSGTTLTACITAGNGRCTVGNIGDSRAYLIGRDVFIRTRDHSYLQDLIDSGKLPEREAIRHPQSNIVTRALGLERDAVPDLYEWDAAGKVLLLTSDGIHDFVEPGQIQEIAHRHDVKKVARDLLAAAVEGGSTDNLSVIVCRFERDLQKGA